MKFIHTADLHLNSALTTRFNTKLAQKLNNQIFIALEEMVDYAKKNKISVIVIAGDLFDNDNATFLAMDKFKKIVAGANEVTFIFTFGNHDYNPNANFDFGKNFITLTAGKSIKCGNVIFTALTNTLNLDPDNYNVVIAHGDTNKEISLAKLRDKNVNYLALGHIHKYQTGKLDARGTYAYSGALTSRGFDECDKKGFIVVDTLLNKTEFIPSNTVQFYSEEVDVTNKSSFELEQDLKKIFTDIQQNSAVKVSLYGEKTDFLDTQYLSQKYEDLFLYVSFTDKTSTNVNLSNLLITEFLKVVKSKNYTTEDKNKIIDLGLKTLK